MNTGYFEIGVAAILVAATVALVLGYQGYLRAGAERRLTRMLKRIGIDPAILSAKDPVAKTAVEEIWRRCHTCQLGAYCNRWLDGEVGGDNSFCPNAPTFLQFKHP